MLGLLDILYIANIQRKALQQTEWQNMKNIHSVKKRH